MYRIKNKGIGVASAECALILDVERDAGLRASFRATLHKFALRHANKSTGSVPPFALSLDRVFHATQLLVFCTLRGYCCEKSGDGISTDDAETGYLLP